MHFQRVSRKTQNFVNSACFFNLNTFKNELKHQFWPIDSQKPMARHEI